MTINSYLTNLSNAAIVRDQEKQSIQRSITTLDNRLKSYFQNDISIQYIFGSYSRGTILPRIMDDRSDIDYMVVFSNSSLKPQSYLNNLRRFAGKYYSNSEIAQSNPTIILRLNHMDFELVPAIDHWFSGLQIPAKASDFMDWIDTDPTGFNQNLSSANQSHYSLIRPLVRLVKYWNAKNNYPFESYQLEKGIVEHGFWFSILSANNKLKDYFVDFMQGLSTGLLVPQYKRDAIDRAKGLIGEAVELERQGNAAAAEGKIKRLLPPLPVLARH